MDIRTIAAQMYTVASFLQTPEDIRQSLKKVSQIGYTAVQLSGLGPINAAELKDALDACNLKVCATHTPVNRIKDDSDKVISDHLLWGCSTVGVSMMPEEYLAKGREGYSAFAKEFSKIGQRYKEAGIHLVYHNHNFEFEKFNGKTGMDILLQESNPQTFGFLIDTYWVQAGGCNPVDWIRKVAGRMNVVHLKDMTVDGFSPIFAELGEGNLDWPAIVKTCQETGVKWYAVEQDICRRDPFESLAISLKYLLNLLVPME